MNQIKYRNEIDGLRTLAVLSVILYHVNPKWIPSGFIGVDIFLVISGYLITNIIVKSSELGKFYISDFYSRRIKRIMPLTYVVLFSILLSGWFLSYPNVYRSESNSVFSALYFLANIRFSLMGNYFTSAEDNPLLHLWSLSLEEQFYFIWPLCIIVCYKFYNSNNIKILLLGLIVFSVILSEYFIAKPSLHQYAYFLLPTRMTGLLLGALLAVINTDRFRSFNFVSIVGLMLLGYSLFFTSKEFFPGYNIIFPLLGTCFIIVSHNSFLTKLFFSNFISEFFGKISFSLYMWHWPLLVYSKRYLDKHYNSHENILFYLFIYFVVLFIVSILSYIYIEKPFREYQAKNRKIFVYLFLFPLFILSGLSLFISKTNGIPGRYSLTDEMTRIETTGCYGSLLKDYCYLNSEGNSSILLIGDSHAGAMNNFIKKMAKNESIVAYEASSGGCDFYIDDFRSTQCENSKNKINEILKNKEIKALVIVKRFDSMTELEVNELMSYVVKKSMLGYRIVLFKQIPKLNDDEYLNEKYMDFYLSGDMESVVDISRIDFNYKRYDNVIDYYLGEDDNVMIIDLNDIFCSDDLCRILDEKRFPLYFDEDHLSAYGAEWAYEGFNKKKDYQRLIDFIH